jgi:hypothetical protein
MQFAFGNNKVIQPCAYEWKMVTKQKDFNKENLLPDYQIKKFREQWNLDLKTY